MYTGVFQQSPNSFVARINIGGKQTRLGSFPTAEEAARRVDQKRVEMGLKPVNFPVDTVGENGDTPTSPLAGTPETQSESHQTPGKSFSGQGDFSPGAGASIEEPGMAAVQIVEWHPHALKYPLLEGDAYIDFRESIRTGQKLPAYYRLVKGRVQGLDGRNRVRACKDLGIECRMEKVDLADEEVAEFIDKLNADRRHLTAEWQQRRRQERIARVAEARQDGESIRSIAESEGVSVGQIQRDLDAANSGVSPDTPDGDELDQSGAEPDETRDEPAQAPPEPPKVKGKDGKKYPANRRKPILCERCARVGPVADCPGCAEARKKNGIDGSGKKKKKPKKKPEPRPELKDKAGKVVPDHLRDAFADKGLRDMVAEFEAIESMFDPTKAVAKAGGYTTHYGFILLSKFEEHIFEAKHRLQLAAEALRVGIGEYVCPKCDGNESRKNGTVCKTCRGYGLIPEHRFAEEVPA